jgi:HEPN domain-containing protein
MPPLIYEFGTRVIMNLHDVFCWQKKKVYTRDDCSESDLIQYSWDHLKTAEKLYELSGRFTWEYLHSAAFLSHLSIELLLKACLLHLEDEFPAVHDLKQLSRQLRKNGINLPNHNKEWLNYLNKFNMLRYPNIATRTEVDINHWGKTKALFEELRKNAPVEIQKQIVLNERYSSNVKSGKTIWSENKEPTTTL